MRCNRGFAVGMVLAVLAVGWFLGLPAAYPETPTEIALEQKILSDAKNASEIMSNLTYLSDAIGPRLTGSANLKRANEWAADRMRSYGLTNVQLEPWELPAGWERGHASARLVEPDHRNSLTVAAMGWTPGTNGKITGDVVILEARTPEELKAYQGKLKGAIVLRGKPAAIRPIKDLNLFVGRGDPATAKIPLATENPTAVDEPAAKQPGQPTAQASKATLPAKPADANKPAEAASKEGQAANARQGRSGGFDNRPGGDRMRFWQEMQDFLRKEGVAVLLQDAGKPHGLLDMGGGWRGGDRVSAAEKLPSLFVAHEHYSQLYRLASRPAPARTRLEVDISNTFVPGPLAVYNTVGEIRGSDKPEELVIVGAHLDSWDLGQGTTDNGTGSCVVLETARLLVKSGVRPRRTIRFCLFSGEEQGLHGSKAYVQRHKDELPRTSAAIVHDTGTGRVVGLMLMGREVLKPILETEVTALKDLGVVDFSLRGMGGSDHASFEREGVPGFMFRQDPSEYRLTHHSQSDTLDKAKEPDLIQGAQVTAILAMRIANRDALLPRDKKEEPRRGEGAGRREP